MTKMDFELEGFPTFQEFGTSNIGQFEENFGMNWLHKSIPSFIAKESFVLYMHLGNNSMHQKNWDLHPKD